MEKAHHFLARFDNRGMGNTLADALNHSGIALYNLNIWYRCQLQMTDEEEGAQVKVVYQSFVYHVNHLRLVLINKLARTTELNDDVYANVEILPRDNDERFFS